jgi:hypothetical protein
MGAFDVGKPVEPSHMLFADEGSTFVTYCLPPQAMGLSAGKRKLLNESKSLFFKVLVETEDIDTVCDLCVDQRPSSSQ